MKGTPALLALLLLALPIAAAQGSGADGGRPMQTIDEDGADPAAAAASPEVRPVDALVAGIALLVIAGAGLAAARGRAHGPH